MTIKYLIFFFCLIIFVLPYQLHADNNAIDSLYQKGKYLLQKNNPQHALKIFKEIIEEDYFRPEGHYGLGLTIQMLFPDSALAVSHYEQAIRLSDDFRAPGRYHYEFQIKDRTANKRCVYQDTIDIVSYDQDHLMLSDLLISDLIEASNRSTQFRKGGSWYTDRICLPIIHQTAF